MNPDPELVVVAFNTGSVREAWASIVTDLPAQVYMLSETRLTTSAQKAFRAELRDSGFSVAYGAALPTFKINPMIAEYGGVANIVAPPFVTRPVYSTSLQWERAYSTTRCCASFVPIGSGRTSFLFLTVYGHPRSSAAGIEREIKERNVQLASDVLAILADFLHIPVLIAGDFNVDLVDLPPISAALSTGLLHDLGTDFAQGEPQPTYHHGKISTTRIDYALCNTQARAMVSSFRVVPIDDSPAPTSKHCPLRITFRTAMADSKISVLKYRPPLAPQCSKLEDEDYMLVFFPRKSLPISPRKTVIELCRGLCCRLIRHKKSTNNNKTCKI